MILLICNECYIKSLIGIDLTHRVATKWRQRLAIPRNRHLSPPN
nr:MAG TPA: RNA polymerase sigma factor [Caudoviricetes sp.]